MLPRDVQRARQRSSSPSTADDIAEHNGTRKTTARSTEFTMPAQPRIAIAANRRVGYQALRLLLSKQLVPAALLLPSGPAADIWSEKMRAALPDVPQLIGRRFRQSEGIQQLAELDLDYLLSVHFPYILPAEVLQLARDGTLNLHPAYLPYNRGWHTPSWAIAEQTPYGATLHWMDDGLDTGDIALQRRIEVRESDTAHQLYQRVLTAELDLLDEALPLLAAGNLPRTPQPDRGTSRRKADLESIRQLQLDEPTTARELLRQLRALTTNRWDESAWFEENGRRFLVRVEIQSETAETSSTHPQRRRAA